MGIALAYGGNLFPNGSNSIFDFSYNISIRENQQYIIRHDVT